MMVQLRYSIVSTCGCPRCPSIHWTDPFSPWKDAYSTLQGRRPTVPMEFIAAPWEGECTVGGREPHHSGHCIHASVASPHQFPIALDHLFLSLILHPSHCRQEPPPSPPPPHHDQGIAHAVPHRNTSRPPTCMQVSLSLRTTPSTARTVVDF